MKEEMKIMLCCINGLGTSAMMKNTLKKVLEQAGVEGHKMAHCSCLEGKGSSHWYDVVFCDHSLTSHFKHAQPYGTKVVGMKNVLCPREMERKLKEVGVLPAS